MKRLLKDALHFFVELWYTAHLMNDNEKVDEISHFFILNVRWSSSAEDDEKILHFSPIFFISSSMCFIWTSDHCERFWCFLISSCDSEHNMWFTSWTILQHKRRLCCTTLKSVIRMRCVKSFTCTTAFLYDRWKYIKFMAINK